MSRPRIGDQPLTTAQRVTRHRRNQTLRLKRAIEALKRIRETTKEAETRRIATEGMAP